MIVARAEASWRRLNTALRSFVERRVASADVDDVLQESLIRIQRGLPDLRDGDRFGPWVYQVTRSAIVDHLRSAARHRRRTEETEAAVSDLGGEADERDDIVQRLVACMPAFIAQLPTPYREAVTLTELEGMTQKDAAEMLGVSVSGMKSRVQRGRRQLRDLFGRCCTFSIDARGCVTGCERRPRNTTPEGC